MIYVTKLSGQITLLNDDLIESVEETPNTVITLTTGKKVIVQEKSDEILKRVIDFRSNISIESIKK